MTLTTGTRLVVTETPDEVVAAVRAAGAPRVLDAMSRAPRRSRAPLSLVRGHRRRRRRGLDHRRGRPGRGRAPAAGAAGHEVRHRHRHRHLDGRHRARGDDGGDQPHGRPQRPGDPDRARRHARRDDRGVRPGGRHPAARALQEGDHARRPRPRRARQASSSATPRRRAATACSRSTRPSSSIERPLHPQGPAARRRRHRPRPGRAPSSTPRTRRCASATARPRSPFMQAGALAPDDGHHRHRLRARERA